MLERLPTLRARAKLRSCCHTDGTSRLTLLKSTSVMLTFDTVRELGGALPDVVDGTAYGAPALKLRGKLLACLATNKSADANSILVRIDLEQRAELLRQDPNVYYITDHYAPHPAVLVRLSKIGRSDLRALLSDAHRFVLSEQKRPVKLTGSRPSSRRSAAPGKPRRP
jgi:hypothetical protein